MNHLQGIMYEVVSRLVVLDWFSKVQKSIFSLSAKIQPVALTAAGLMIIVVGCMYMFGDDTKRTAKSWLVGILIGVLFISGATTFINTYAKIVAF